MSEDEAIVLMFYSIGVTLLLAWLLISNRRLKRKLRMLDQQVQTPADSSPRLAPAATARDSEVEELRKRVQVLERIATDGNPVLEREIDALRRTG